MMQAPDSRNDDDSVGDRYGQMTAGSYCYIGPQGIVHGTTVSTIHCVYGPQTLAVSPFSQFSMGLL